MIARLGIFALLGGACGGTHHVRTQLVDATTGDPIRSAELKVRVDARASRDSSWCRHGDSWFTGYAEREPPKADTSVTYGHVITDDTGWAQLAIPRRRGYCRHEPYRVEVIYRDRSIASINPNAHEVVLPVFNASRSDPDLESSPFVRERSTSAFSSSEAIRSVARERLTGMSDRAPPQVATLVPSDDGEAFVVRSLEWTRDPWQLLSEASIRRYGDRWHVELRRLGVELGADGLPRLEVPARFTSAAAREAARAWATEGLAGTVWRAVVDAKLLYEERAPVLPRDTLVGKVDRAWEIRIASPGSPLTAFAITYATNMISVARLEATLAVEAGSARVARLEPFELQTMQDRIDSCAFTSESAHGGPAAFVDIVVHLEANGGTAAPDLRACSPSTEAGCVVGTDRAGHPWRARCWRDVVHDHPLFAIDRPVFRTRAWRADVLATQTTHGFKQP